MANRIRRMDYFEAGRAALYFSVPEYEEGDTGPQPGISGGRNMLLDLGKFISFVMSILSLCALLDTAFFIQATRWEDRLAASIVRILFAGSVCMISGVLFHVSQPQVPLVRTLPVRLFLWAMSGFTLFFVLGWYVDAYYMPLFWRNLPH